QISQPEQADAERLVGAQETCRVRLALSQAEELCPKVARFLVLPPRHMKRTQAPQYGEEPCRFPELLTQRLGTRIGLSDFRGCEAFGGHERRAEGALHVQLLSGALCSIRERLEELERLGEVTDGLARRGLLHSALASPPPVNDGLLYDPCCGVVLCHDL